MSTFSEFQVRRFRFLFQQYLDLQPLKATDAAPTTASAGAGILPPRVVYGLNATQLQALLTRLGPPISTQQAQKFISQYKTDNNNTAAGLLEFEDLLELLADYEVTLTLKRKQALDYYKQKSQNHDFRQNQAPIQSIFPTVESFLRNLVLDDPEGFFSSQINEISDEKVILSTVDANFLRRKVSCRIVRIRNIEALLRTKYRGQRGVDYQSADFLVRIECAGIVKETVVLYGSSKHEWDQDLTFDIEAPNVKPNELKAWAESQCFQFTLYDYVGGGANPYTEMVAYASIPLSHVLLTTLKPLPLVIEMKHVDATRNDITAAVLEVSLLDLTQEKWAWAKVLDKAEHIEDYWSRKFGKSFQKDLKDVALNNGATTSKLWDIYVPIMTSLRQLFPRRSYHAVFLDESNTFRFLSSLLRPLSLPDHRLSTSLDIAAALAQLPWTKFNKSNQFDNQTLLGCTEAGGRTKSIDTTSACHFTRQAQSPASFLLRKCGSLLDYAMMLCGVFLGAGMNAFVVIGTAQNREYIWVMTNSQLPESKSTAIVHWDVMDGYPVYSQHDARFIFETATTVFNRDNIWFNIQKTDDVTGQSFSWDFANNKHWAPFLADKVRQEIGGLQCFYDEPTLMLPTSINQVCPQSARIREWYVVNELAVRISQYRRAYLSTQGSSSTTVYHRDMSKTLHSLIPRFEKLCQLNGIAGSNGNNYGRLMSIPNYFLPNNTETDSILNSTTPSSNSTFSTHVEQLAVQMLPDRYVLRCKVVKCTDHDIPRIMEELIESGCLDTKTPNAIFTLAARSLSQTAVSTAMWVIIGYMSDFGHDPVDVAAV